MTDAVVIDEWTVVLLGDAELPRAAAERLRDLVEAELAAAAGRLTTLLSPGATVLLAPR
jgi:hypothetical protein